MSDDEKLAPFTKDRSEGKPSSWRDRFMLTKLADMVPDDEPLWLIDNLIPAGPSLGVIFGPPKSGKTFLVAHMFLHVAMGRHYCGCAVQQGGVIYITKEGVRGFQRRMMAARNTTMPGRRYRSTSPMRCRTSAATTATPTSSLH